MRQNENKRSNHLMKGCITRGTFQWENLMWHSTACAAGQSEQWLTACGEILTSGPLGMVLSTVCFQWGIWTPHLIHSSLGPPEFHIPNDVSIGSDVLQHSRSLQTDRLTNRQTDRPRYSVCSNRLHLATAAIQSKNSNTEYHRDYNLTSQSYNGLGNKNC